MNQTNSSRIRLHCRTLERKNQELKEARDLLGEQQQEIGSLKTKLAEAVAMQSKDEAIKMLQKKHDDKMQRMEDEVAQAKSEAEKVSKDHLENLGELARTKQWLEELKHNSNARYNTVQTQLNSMEKVQDANVELRSEMFAANKIIIDL